MELCISPLFKVAWFDFSFSRVGEYHWGEFWFQNFISVWGLENEVKSISFSKISKQESNVNKNTKHLEFIKVVLRSI